MDGQRQIELKWEDVAQLLNDYPQLKPVMENIALKRQLSALEAVISDERSRALWHSLDDPAPTEEVVTA